MALQKIDLHFRTAESVYLDVGRKNRGDRPATGSSGIVAAGAGFAAAETLLKELER